MLTVTFSNAAIHLTKRTDWPLIQVISRTVCKQNYTAYIIFYSTPFMILNRIALNIYPADIASPLPITLGTGIGPEAFIRSLQNNTVLPTC